MQLRYTTCLIFIVFQLIPKVSAIDGRLIVPNTWHSGQRVKLICQISGAAEERCIKSKGIETTTIFRINTNQRCTVQLRWHGNCLAKTSAYHFPDYCWCEQGPGETVNYVYTILVDQQEDNGTWSCEKGCDNGGPFPNDYKIDNSAGFNKTVIVLKPLTCDPAGGYSAVKGFESNEAVCVCDKNREIGTCGPCTVSLWMGGYCTGREQVPSIIALVVILVLVLTLNALYFGFLIHKQGWPLNNQGAEKVDMQPNMEMHQKMDMNTHQKKMHYAVESNDQKDEPSGVSSWDSETDQSEGPTVTN